MSANTPVNPGTAPGSTEHVILVAFTVVAPDRREAQEALVPMLQPLLWSNDDSSPVESWWIAEDERYDGSDNDSAVFVYPGSQAEASQALHDLGLTASCNLVANRRA